MFILYPNIVYFWKTEIMQINTGGQSFINAWDMACDMKKKKRDVSKGKRVI